MALRHPQLQKNAVTNANICAMHNIMHELAIMKSLAHKDRDISGIPLSRLFANSQPIHVIPIAGWGLAMATSRSYRFKRIAGHAMVPLVDMANHSETSNAEIHYNEDGSVSMIANKEVRQRVTLPAAWLGINADGYQCRRLCCW